MQSHLQKILDLSLSCDTSFATGSVAYADVPFGMMRLVFLDGVGDAAQVKHTVVLQDAAAVKLAQVILELHGKTGRA